MTSHWLASQHQIMEVTAVSVYEKLKALNITLPELTQPVAAFVPFARSGKLLFVSGYIAKIDGKPWVGRLGRELSTEQGKDAARGVANRSAWNPTWCAG